MWPEATATQSKLYGTTGDRWRTVRSRLTYGQEAFFTAPRGERGLLERVETQALKLALGLNRGAINDLRRVSDTE